MGSERCIRGRDDGGDGGDELATACADANGFYCGDDESNWTSYSPNGCVPDYYICDGWADCVDAGDEAGCSANRVETSEDIDAAKKATYIEYSIEQERRMSNPIATPEQSRDDECGGSRPLDISVGP